MIAVREYWPLIKKTYNAWDRHHAPELGAALSYYTVLALAPLLIVVIAIIGLVLGQEAARGEIVSQIQGMVGTEGARAIETIITNANKPATGTISAILGLITLFFGASGVFAELHDSLNRIWDVPARKSEGFMKMIRTRFLSFGMVLAIGFLLLVSLVVSAGLQAAGKFMGGLLPIPAFVMSGVNLIVSLAFITVLFGLIFRFLPDEKIAWSDVSLGAFTTALLFTVGKFAIGMYLGKASIGSAYGAAGSLVIVLVWVYYSAQIFFFGAEFTHVYAETYGSLRGREKSGTEHDSTPETAASAPERKAGRSDVPARAQHSVEMPVARPNPNSVVAPHAARALSLVVVAALGGLGWWRNRSSHRHPADM